MRAAQREKVCAEREESDEGCRTKRSKVELVLGSLPSQVEFGSELVLAGDLMVTESDELDNEDSNSMEVIRRDRRSGGRAGTT